MSLLENGLLFNLKVKDLTTSSWICLLKLGLRPSFFKRVFFDGFLFNLKVENLTTSSWICLLKLSLRPRFFFLMSLLGWVSVQSESWGSYHEFLDLSFEAGPSAQLFFKWVFLDGRLFNLKVEDLTTRFWTCLLKLSLRPSFFSQWIFLGGLMSLLGWVHV